MPKTAITTTCPDCGNNRSSVTHSAWQSLWVGRSKVIGTKRRRVCEGCGKPFLTIEVAADYLADLLDEKDSEIPEFFRGE